MPVHISVPQKIFLVLHWRTVSIFRMMRAGLPAARAGFDVARTTEPAANGSFSDGNPIGYDRTEPIQTSSSYYYLRRCLVL
jgi:hypothetical protein